MERFNTPLLALSLPKSLPISTSLLTLILIFVLAGCAGGEPEDLNQGAQLPDADPGQEDIDDQLPPEDRQDSTESEEDVEPDPPPLCTPGSKRCADENTVETCLPDGQAYSASQCRTGEVCEQGACIVEQVCTPNEKHCNDERNLNICRPDGGGHRVEECAAGTVCVIDQCISGSPTGAACEENDDCAGGICRCGAEEDCPPNERRYCTSDCSQNSCGGDQVCWRASQVDAEDYDHCLPSCEAECSISGLNCVEVQTKVAGETTWKGACLPPGLKPVGSRCESDDECINGSCSSEYFGFGVCTYRCEGQRCPSKTACAKLTSSQAWCSPLCTSGETYCPLKKDANDWSVSCSTKLLDGGGNAVVCS